MPDHARKSPKYQVTLNPACDRIVKDQLDEMERRTGLRNRSAAICEIILEWAQSRPATAPKKSRKNPG